MQFGGCDGDERRALQRGTVQGDNTAFGRPLASISYSRSGIGQGQERSPRFVITKHQVLGSALTAACAGLLRCESVVLPAANRNLDNGITTSRACPSAIENHLANCDCPLILNYQHGHRQFSSPHHRARRPTSFHLCRLEIPLPRLSLKHLSLRCCFSSQAGRNQRERPR